MAKDYTNACVYKIYCKDPAIKYVYVGSSTNIVRRIYAHKSSCNNENGKLYNDRLYRYIRQNGGWYNFSVEKLQDVTNKEALFKTEREWFEKFPYTLNKNIPSRSLREWNVAHRDYHRQYYLANKGKVIPPKNVVECNKERISCACGSCVLKVNYAQHCDTVKHLAYIATQADELTTS